MKIFLFAIGLSALGSFAHAARCGLILAPPPSYIRGNLATAAVLKSDEKILFAAVREIAETPSVPGSDSPLFAVVAQKTNSDGTANYALVLEQNESLVANLILEEKPEELVFESTAIQGTQLKPFTEASHEEFTLFEFYQGQNRLRLYSVDKDNRSLKFTPPDPNPRSLTLSVISQNGTKKPIYNLNLEPTRFAQYQYLAGNLAPSLNRLLGKMASSELRLAPEFQKNYLKVYNAPSLKLFRNIVETHIGEWSLNSKNSDWANQMSQDWSLPAYFHSAKGQGQFKYISEINHRSYFGRLSLENLPESSIQKILNTTQNTVVVQENRIYGWHTPSQKNKYYSLSAFKPDHLFHPFQVRDSYQEVFLGNYEHLITRTKGGEFHIVDLGRGIIPNAQDAKLWQQLQNLAQTSQMKFNQDYNFLSFFNPATGEVTLVHLPRKYAKNETRVAPFSGKYTEKVQINTALKIQRVPLRADSPKALAIGASIEVDALNRPTVTRVFSDGSVEKIALGIISKPKFAYPYFYP